VRFINVLIFLAVIFGAAWLYIYLEEFAKWIGVVEFQGTHRSMSELILKKDIPQAPIAYTVLSICGAVRGGPTNLDGFRGRDKWNSAGYAAAASG
jgi:hypothetical protein